jgi:Rod binding domain-containing protein
MPGMPAPQARQVYENARRQSDLAAAREALAARGRASAAAGGPAPAVRRSQIDRKSKLYEAAQEFEAIFVKQMLDSMRQTVQKTGLIEGGMAEDVFEDMLYDQYALKMTRTAGFGLADQIYLQLSNRGADPPQGK